MFMIGAFYLLTTFIGFGARAFLGRGGRGGGRHGRQPRGAEPRRSSSAAATGTFGGDLFLAVIAGGRVRDDPRGGRRASCSRRPGAVAHDIWSNIIRKGKDSEHEEVLGRADRGGRRSARSRSSIAIIGGEGLNVSFMVGLAFAVAASANFPALLLALTWRRFNTTGAVTGVLFGVDLARSSS